MQFFRRLTGDTRTEFKGEMGALGRALHPAYNAQLRKLSGISRYFPDLLAASMVVNLLGLALPLTLLQVYDRILPNSSLDTLVALVLGVMGAQILEGLLRVTRSAITSWTSARFEHMASSRAFNSLLTQPTDDFERKGTGAHAETLNAIHALKDFYSGQAYLSVFDIPFALLYFALLMIFGGWMVLVPLSLALAFSLSAIMLGKKMYLAMAKRMASDDSRVNFIVEILSGIGSIKALAMEEQMRRRYERLLDNSAQAEFHVAELSAKAGSLALLYSHLSTILVVSVGAIMVIDGDMTTGVLAACSLLAGRCVQPMQAALDRWTRFQTARLAEERLGQLIYEDQERPARPVLPTVEGRIRLENLTLAFGPAPLLEGVSVDIKAGEMIGINGENGSGKSSVLGLISGSIPPTDGRILLDDYVLSDYDPISIRRQVAYIPQRPELFRGTILENLTLFDPTRTDEAKEIAHKLGIDRVAARLPLGYETVVGEGAQDALPRGIRQLLVIAQALVHRPRVVLFDEANSAVDGAGDQALRNLLEELKGSCTIILVTPRPSLLNLADRQFKLANSQLLDTSQVASLPHAVAPEPVTSVTPNTPPAPQPADTPPVAPLQSAANTNVLAAPPPMETGRKSTNTDFLREIENGSPFGRCLLPLLQALKWTGDMRHLAEALPHFENSLDTVSFRNVMANLGFGSSEMPIHGELLDHRLLPCLFVGLDGLPMVLEEAANGDLLARRTNEDDAGVVDDHSLWGNAYFFAIEEDANPLPQTAGPQTGWFKKILGRFHTLIWSVLAQSLIINVLSLGVPLFTMSVYDKVVASGEVGMLVSFLAGILIVIAADEMLRELRSKATGYVGSRVGYIVSSTVFERTLLLPLPLTERASIGSQLARFKDLESFRDFFGGGAATVLLDLPFVFIYLIVLTMLGGPVALVPVAALIIFAVLVVALMPIIRRRIAAAGRASTRRNEFLIESLLKMRSLHSAAIEPVWRARFRSFAATAAMSSSETSVVSGMLATVSQSLVILSGLATMAVGVTQVMAGNMTAGALIASMMVVWRVLAPIQTGFSTVARLEQTRSSIRQLETLVGFRSERDGRAGGSGGLLQLRGAVAFSRVSLRYSNDADPALLGVSFQAQPGDVVAIVGADGAGKSTLLKVLTGLYMPQAGNVTIDDLDIRQMDPIELRKAIGYAPQIPQLFFGTIAQNLRLAHPTASDAELRWALEAAGIWEEVSGLERGINTRVGDSRTNRMSPSLAQGISLARAYLKKSPILLLDEPVTGLDFEGDRRFRLFIESMRGKATILMVTHRPSHLGLADQIIVLENGAVRIAGPAAEVRGKLATR